MKRGVENTIFGKKKSFKNQAKIVQVKFSKLKKEENA